MANPSPRAYTMPMLGAIGVALVLLLGSGCASLGSKGGDPFQKSSFVLPADGVRNDNKMIGPFCCTGRTITVQDRRGRPVGYVYFFAWEGQAYNVGPAASIFPSVKVLLAGLQDLSDPASPLVESSVLINPERDYSRGAFAAVAGAIVYRLRPLKWEVVEGPGGRLYFKHQPLELSVQARPSR